MASKQPSVSEHEFHNWIKANLAILITKEGIQPFVEETVQTFHERCLSEIRTWNNLSEGATCNECSLKDLKLKTKCCPYNICTQFINRIHQAHRYQSKGYKGPSFENTDASEWCTNSWEVAKCYMPRDGYKDVKEANATDFNGIIAVIINHIEFASKVNCLQNFEKGRKQCNAIRHSSTLGISDEALQKHYKVFENILTDQVYLASCTYAQNALEKMSKLRNSTHVVTISDIIKILDDKQLTETNEQNLQLLKDTEKVLRDTEPNISVESLHTTLSYVTKLQALKEDLITFYEQVHSSIPISPLVPANDVPIEDFYVQQKMEQVELNAKEKRTTHRTSVDSYKAMFMNGSALCRSIYIMAQAGAGKTTFAKRLCNVWCFTKGGGGKEPHNLSQSARDTLDNFDILFLLLLRDLQGSECDIDEMIQSQIIRHLSRSADYDHEFLLQVLHRQTCLVLLDGLDEWSHPHATKCQNVKPIPHQKARPKCTVLSTTRPWKMFESGISNSMIDKCIELKELDESSSDILINNVISTFTDTQANEKKEMKDLQVQIKEHSLDWLICIPLILIQVVCLWLDNKTLGKSKCQIYSNIIDFLLEHAAKKGKLSKPSTLQSAWSNKSKPLNCLRTNEYCKKYNSLLIAVGELAFKALCSETRELSLVFESSLVKQTLSDEHLQDCLQSGILTENRTKRVSARRVNYSFMHKTFQEYFCAFYIATIEIRACTNDMLKQCQSVGSILELSGIFVFLCGLRPTMFNEMSVCLAELISKDKICQDFRRKVCTSINWNTNYKVLKELQDMYIDCIKESEAENNKSLNIIQTDFVIDVDCRDGTYSGHLKKLVNMNKDYIKSVKIYGEPGVALSSFIRDFTLTGLKHLDKLEMIVDKLNDGDLDLLLSGSCNTLKCLSICKDIGSKVDPPCDLLSESSVRTVRSMSSLEAIMLECVTMEHEQLQDLFHFLEGRKEMTEICLGYIKCSVHGNKCVGFKLDLSMHSNLTMLEVGSIPLSNIQMNTQSLYECRVGRFDSEKVLPSVLCSLQNSPGLQSLMVFGIDRPDEIKATLNTLHSLATLRVLVIKRVNIGDHVMDIQSKLELIKMSSVKMASSTFDSIVKKVENHPHTVTCELLSCEIIPEEEYENVKGNIKKSERIDISYDKKEENKTFKIKFTSRPKPYNEATN